MTNFSEIYTMTNILMKSDATQVPYTKSNLVISVKYLTIPRSLEMRGYNEFFVNVGKDLFKSSLKY